MEGRDGEDADEVSAVELRCSSTSLQLYSWISSGMCNNDFHRDYVL